MRGVPKLEAPYWILISFKNFSYPTTNENLSPRALAISMNVESCMSVCPC